MMLATIGSLNAREDALIARIEELLPDYRVRGSLGAAEDARRFDISLHHEVQVGLAACQASKAGEGQGGAEFSWTIRIVEGELRSPDRRRRGSVEPENPTGLYPSVEAIREGLNGMVLASGSSPLLSKSGRLVRAGNPSAVWEETFIEHRPPLGGTPPLLATGTEYSQALPSPLEVGTEVLAPLDQSAIELEIGDYLVVEAVDGSACESLGAIEAMDAGGVTIGRPPSIDFASGASIYRLSGAFAFTVCPTGTEEFVERNMRVDFDLEGGGHSVSLGAARTETDWVFAPVTRIEAQAFLTRAREAHRSGVLLAVDGNGMLFRAQYRKKPRFVGQNFDLGVLKLAFDFSPIGELSTYEGA